MSRGTRTCSHLTLPLLAVNHPQHNTSTVVLARTVSGTGSRPPGAAALSRLIFCVAPIHRSILVYRTRARRSVRQATKYGGRACKCATHLQRGARARRRGARRPGEVCLARRATAKYVASEKPASEREPHGGGGMRGGREQRRL
eukprot:COSAG03_NODE_11162_length_608_cov_1.510806_1_plen_143_part_10